MPEHPREDVMEDVMERATELVARIDAVRSRVAAAARRAGRDPAKVTVVGVTKTVPLQTIAEAFASGLADFGENRVQEAEEKIGRWQAETSRDARSRPRWHLVGHLQTNKAKRAVDLFDVIHSVDSVRLANLLSAHASRLGRTVPILLQVNVSREPTKFGFAPEEVDEALAAILPLPGLAVVGLMTIAAEVENPELARPTFRALRELRDRLAARYPDAHLSELSMGMTGDFEVAIEEGATYVRVGRAIFGERPRNRIDERRD